MIDTVRADALLRIARDLEVARVALVGDTAQLKAVDAGQPFRLLQKAGMATATMDEVLRQARPRAARDGRSHEREGEPGAAIAVLGHRVREAPREELGIEAARRWLALAPERQGGHPAPRAHARDPPAGERRRARGARGGRPPEGPHARRRPPGRPPPHTRTGLRDRELRGRRHSPCSTGTTTDAAGTISAPSSGHRRRAGSSSPTRDGGERRFRPSGNAAWYLRICDTERIELRAGDRVRWTRNRAAPARPFRPSQGTGPCQRRRGGDSWRSDTSGCASATGSGRAFNLALTDPQLRHLDHAYCSTVHAAQGRTARAAIAVLDAGGMGRPRAVPCGAQPGLGRVPAADRRPRRAGRAPGRRPELSEDGALEALGIDLSETPSGGPPSVRGPGERLAGAPAGGRGNQHPYVLRSRATGT